jgi:uncharacterized protein (DUF849 family)
VKEGALEAPALVQLCMGVPWGAPDDLRTFLAMVDAVPPDWTWSAFSIGRNATPFVAAAVLAGGNVRVGLEDNLYLERGVLATNAQLVDKAVGIIERLAHVAECLPEICTLDCGTMNFAEADYVMTNTPGMLRAMGRMMTHLGVKPEIEAFDTGHLWFAKELVKEGVLEAPALVQLCMGVPWGAPDDLNTFMAMVNNVPDDWTFSAFSLGRHQMAYAAAAVLAGGHVRVGLEDNLWLEKGVLATNAQLVERAVGVVEGMGARVLGPQEVREKLGLTKRAPAA